jgi:hypothetical protein
MIRDLDDMNNPLREQLGISQKRKVPVTLSQKISRTPAGKTISNPTKAGKKRIKVTPLMKKRAVLAKNIPKWRKSKKGKSKR